MKYILTLIIIVFINSCSTEEKKGLNDFGLDATNLFLYYNDLEKAGEFYSGTLGMEIVVDYKMALILRMTKDSYLILVDANKGMHTADEPKTVALALLTDQLDSWYKYLKIQNVEFKHEYNPKEGSAHDGFVVYDTEGYLLEFERFNKHDENNDFIPFLEENINNSTITYQAESFPEELKIHSTITWLYYDDILMMQEFYSDEFGFPMVADQGWTKIHKVSETSFMGLVDGSRGMHKTSENKAVNVGFIIKDLQGWMDYVKDNNLLELREQELSTGPEGKYKAFVGYDAGNYFLEFDRFFEHKDNSILLKYLEVQ
jgi:catechol 2,3-dioxygenase-like lactoylglutathione lyase family enzyme